ncbi:MBL fold metallo-hydrolase [Arthrobacter zhaoguopingii]|uniref:MBL fold metallo-hydrolase n=1 Tax=Arthrobacter zhaoguopingii TaxID=2681491 RepID=UPI00135A99F2|nr:MBL fold metallo-hydrolase [Arthrobacter zhaoguopingii]
MSADPEARWKPFSFTDAAASLRLVPTAPVPKAARGPKVPDEGYYVEELADGMFLLSDGSYQMMFVVTDDGVVAVDAPPTLGRNILRAIKGVTSKPITQIVYSHQHADHVGAMSLYPQDVPRYAQRITAERLRKLGDPNRPLPTVEFDDGYTLRSGDHTLQLDYQGPNHAEGNIFIHEPKRKVLMLVDVIFPGWVPFSNLAVSANVPGYVTAVDQTLGYSFEKLVSGHVTRTGTRKDVEVQAEYLRDLHNTTEAALSSVDLGRIMAPVDMSNVWAVFRAYLDAVAAKSADELIPRWVDRLGGADVFTLPNAWAMMEALRLDYGSLGPFGIAD